MRSLTPCKASSVTVLVSRRFGEDGGVRDMLSIEARGVRSLCGGMNAFVVPVPLNTEAGQLTKGNILSSVYWAPVLKSAYAQTMMPHRKAGKSVSGIHSSVAYERIRETVVIVANSIEEFEREINKVPSDQRPQIDYPVLEEFWSTYPRHAMAFALFGKKDLLIGEVVRMTIWFHAADHHNVFVPTAVGTIDADLSGNADIPYTVMLSVSDMADNAGVSIDYPEDLSPEVRKLAPTKVIGEVFPTTKAVDDLILRIDDAREGEFNPIFYPALSRHTLRSTRASMTSLQPVQAAQTDPEMPYRPSRPTQRHNCI